MMKEDQNLSWEMVKTEHLCQDEWIDFRRVRYRFPDGSEMEPFYNYSRKSYVIILARDEHGRFLCVRQYRHGIAKVTVEFPAGGIEPEDPKAKLGPETANVTEETAFETAKRELREETGYVSDSWSHLITVPSNPTIADNYAHIYVAEHCRKVSGQDLDDTEFLEAERYTAGEIEDMIARGTFAQGLHIMAFYMWKAGAAFPLHQVESTGQSVCADGEPCVQCGQCSRM